MSTGQTSSSFLASSASPATSSETSTSMKTPSCADPDGPGREAEEPSGIDFVLHDVRDLVDPLDDGDAGCLEARDLLRRRVLLALDDRAGVAEAHALHLLVVHELAGHEGDDRQSRVVLLPPVD